MLSSEYAVTVATRRYDQRLRAQAAEQTRRRILDAVDEELRSAPTRPLSVDRIARAAGVARSTVYVVFGDRTGLMEAFGTAVLERGGFHRVLEAVADPDPLVSLGKGIDAGVRTYGAHRDVIRAIVSMAALDPEATGDALRRMDGGRFDGMLRLAKRFKRSGLLRGDLTARQAAHRLFVTTSFDAFD